MEASKAATMKRFLEFVNKNKQHCTCMQLVIVEQEDLVVVGRARFELKSIAGAFYAPNELHSWAFSILAQHERRFNILRISFHFIMREKKAKKDVDGHHG